MKIEVVSDGTPVRGTDGVAVECRSDGYHVEHFRNGHDFTAVVRDIGPFKSQELAEIMKRAYRARWAA